MRDALTSFVRWFGFHDGAHFAAFLVGSYLICSLGLYLWREFRREFTDDPPPGDSL